MDELMTYTGKIHQVIKFFEKNLAERLHWRFSHTFP